MASKIQDKECFCAFVATLGDFLAPVKGLLTSVEALLITAKIMLALIPVNLDDVVKKEGLKILLELVEAAMAPIEAPITSLNRYVRAYADCSPVKNMANIVEQIRKYSGLDTLDDWRYELDQMIDAIERESLKVQAIDDLLANIQDMKEALDACGTDA